MLKTIGGLILALSLGGCATIDGIFSDGRSILAGGTSLISTIPNPIGLDQQYQVEAAYAIVTRSALTYTRLRQCRASEPASLANVCARRSVKLQIQAADRKVRSVLVPFRNFLANNQTVSAASLGNAIRSALLDYHNLLVTNGVRVQ